MKLLELHLSNIGPFIDARLTLERDVTVITGRNDTGKSSLLNVIRMLCAKQVSEVVSERDVNYDRLTSPQVEWDLDNKIECSATFELTNRGKPATAQYEAKLAPKCWSRSSFIIRPPGSDYGHNGAMERLPKVVFIRPGLDEGIRQPLNLSDPNSVETKLLSIAFGTAFSWPALKKLSDIHFQTAVTKAKRKLNQRLKVLLPASLPFQFEFQNASDRREALFVSLVDEHGCSTPLGMRGQGIQRMVDLLGRLAIENLGDQPVILLLDEPETSLHADAQHVLRRNLEKLGASPNIQVIYATHSPCMVNCMRPQSIRLLRRIPHGETAVSVIENSAFTGNFASVRSSLGMSPADSLLYAPVAVVVSGQTEYQCLPVILNRLEKAGIQGFEEVGNLLSFAIFIESGGDGNVANLFRIAEAQGSRVVAFCDGDTGRRWRNHIEKLGNDQSVILDEGKEFEDIVPRATYFAALAEHLGEPELTEDRFVAWLAEAKLNPRLSFTKQVSRWLTDGLELRDLEKPDVMFVAANAVELDSLNLEPLKKLVATMRRLLGE